MVASENRFGHIDVTSNSCSLKVLELTTVSTTEAANQRPQRPAWVVSVAALTA